MNKPLVCLFFCAAAWEPAWAQTAEITLGNVVQPASAVPGVTVVTVTASGFPAGALSPGSVLVRLQNRASGDGAALETPASGVQLVVGSTRRVIFVVPGTAVVPAPTVHDLSLRGVMDNGTPFASRNVVGLTLQPVAGLVAVESMPLVRGEAALVLTRAQLTSFQTAPSLDAQAGEGVSAGVWAEGSQSPPATSYGAFGPAIAVDAGIALTLLRVAANASLGPRDFQLRAGSTTYRKPAALQVQNAAAPSASLALLTLAAVTSVVPALPGSLVSVSVSGLPEGVLAANQLRLLLQPRNGGAPLVIVPLSVSASAGGFRNVEFSVPANLALPAPADFLLTLYGSTSGYGTSPTGVTFCSANRLVLPLAPPPVQVTLTSVQPAAARAGQLVALSGTGFPAGELSPSGITVSLIPADGGPTRQVIASAVSPATGGSRQITFQVPSGISAPQPVAFAVSVSGSQPAFSSNALAFTVAPPPRLLSATPNVGQRGQSFGVTVTGQYTNFSPGLTNVSFGTGISVTSVTVASATQLTAQISIAANAGSGARTLIVNTNGEPLSWEAAFTVADPGLPPGDNHAVSALVSVRNGPVMEPAPGASQVVSTLLSIRNGAASSGSLPPGLNEVTTALLSVANGGGAALPPGFNEAVAAPLSIRNGPVAIPPPGTSAVISSLLSVYNGTPPGGSLPGGYNETVTVPVSIANGLLTGLSPLASEAVSPLLSLRIGGGSAATISPRLQLLLPAVGETPGESGGAAADAPSELAVPAGATVQVQVANPGGAVAHRRVKLLVNGVVLDEAAQLPFDTAFVVPSSARELTLTAIAEASGGEQFVTARQRLVVTPEATTARQVLVLHADRRHFTGGTVVLRQPGWRAEFFPGVTGPTAPEHLDLAPRLVRSLSSPALLNPGALFGSDPWALALPSQGLVRLSGWLQLEEAGEYAWQSDHPELRVLLDQEELARDGRRSLAPGLHAIEVTGQLQNGAAGLRLRLSRNGGPPLPLPASLLWHDETVRLAAEGALLLRPLAWMSQVRILAGQEEGLFPLDSLREHSLAPLTRSTSLPHSMKGNQ